MSWADISHAFSSWNRQRRSDPIAKRSVVFVVSSAHSGSTWTGYIIGSHSQSAFLGEYHRGWNAEIRQPCAWCAAHGREACEVLQGIDRVPETDAFDFAFSRFAKPVLVDTSKWVNWAGRFVGHYDFEIAAVHLVRDPRGYYHSRKRRTPQESWPSLIPEWLRENAEIIEFLRAGGLRHRTVFYEDLAGDPSGSFPGLFDFIGLGFEAAALRYWEHPHHGFAANGASSFLLRDLPLAVQLPYLVTGDDPFYTARQKTFFSDNRWMSELSGEERGAIEENTEVAEFLRQFGRRMTTDGLRSQPGPASQE